VRSLVLFIPRTSSGSLDKPRTRMHSEFLPKARYSTVTARPPPFSLDEIKGGQCASSVAGLYTAS
jgi:hypothetical protein